MRQFGGQDNEGSADTALSMASRYRLRSPTVRANTLSQSSRCLQLEDQHGDKSLVKCKAMRHEPAHGCSARPT
jgi:hypothetical protein